MPFACSSTSITWSASHPARTAGGHVDLVKAVDRKSGEPVELAFDERGERVDFAERLAALDKRRGDKFGRVHETLHERIERSADDEQIPIVVWPRVDLPPAPYAKPADRRSLEAPSGEQKVDERLRKAVAELNAGLQRSKIELTADNRPDEGVPSVRATATVKQIRELANDTSIGAIFYDDTSAITDLGDSIAAARSDRAHLAGFDGTGIRVAVLEDGPSVTTNLAFADRFTSTPSASDHARLTSAVVKNTEANLPHGHAPDCDLYSANSSRQRRASLGHAGPALHRRQPELPPRQRAGWRWPPGRRPAQGLAGAALAVSDDRPSRRQLLAGRRRRHHRHRRTSS